MAKRFPLSAMTLAISSVCSAETTSQAPTLEEVEVIGFRANLQSAQELKRNANTVKDVITASDIGALPDKSVTEALMRVPGVTIERFASSDDPNHFAAEGTGVVVRGLKRVRSEINGRESFSARRDGAGLNFEDIPPELLGSVEVVKNTTADLIAGGVAGTVNLNTRKPFDSDEMVLFAQAGSSYGDHVDEWTPKYSGLFSNQWATGAGDFGFLLSGSHSEYQDRGDGVALDNYYERSATANEMPQFGPWGTALADYPDQTLYAPAGVAIRTAESERERDGFSSALQWRSPGERLELTAEYIRSSAALEWNEHVVQYGEQGFNVNPNNIGVSNAMFDSQGFMQSGVLSPNAQLAQSRWRKTENNIDELSLHLTLRPTDRLRIDLDAQQLDSSFEALDYTLSTQFHNTDVFFDRSGDRLVADFQGENLTSPTSEDELYLRSAMDKEDDYDADLNAYQIDLEYDFDNSPITSVKLGAYQSRKQTTVRDSAWNWGEFSCAWTSYANGCKQANALDHPELFEIVTFNASDFHGGGVLPTDQSFLFPRLDQLHNWNNFHATTSTENGGYSLFTPLRERDCVLEGGADCQLQGAFLPSEISSSKEQRREFYVMANYAFDQLPMPIKGNIGLRHINWQVESSGATQFPIPLPGWWELWATNLWNSYTPEQRTFQNNLNTLPVEVKGSDYSKLLPSFNLSVALNDDNILRFAYSKNVYFPTFSDVRYFRTITESHREVYDSNNVLTGYSDINFDGETGNPQIKPEESTNYDLTYEWYFASAGSLTASLFYKEFDGIIRDRLYIEVVENSESNVSAPVNFIQKTNQDKGHIQGIELAYQQFYDQLPGAFSGLGFAFNYTYLDQSGMSDEIGFGDGVAGAGGRNNFRAFNNLDLPGYSKDTLNATLMYEKYGIEARLAWNWRSEYLLTRRDADMFAPVIAEDTGQLDASIAYRFNDHLKVGFEATNLLDEIIETQLMYNQAGTLTPRNYFKTDRRYGLYLQLSY